MVKILAVYDADPAFGERLADYVNQKEKIPFTAMAFSSLDRLREYGEEHPIEILLVDECSRALVGDVKDSPPGSSRAGLSFLTVFSVTLLFCPRIPVFQGVRTCSSCSSQHPAD